MSIGDIIIEEDVGTVIFSVEQGPSGGGGGGGGSGDVEGPAGGTADGDIALFDDTTGKLIRKAVSGDRPALRTFLEIYSTAEWEAIYDPTAVQDDAFNQDNMVDGTTNKNFTAAEETKLAGIEALADVTDAVNVGSSIHGATAKTTPTGADTIAIIDSAASNVLKKLSFTNLVAYLNSVSILTAFLTSSSTATLTNKTINANDTGNSITNLEVADFAANVVDTDGTLTANSATRIPSQSAVKTYADTKLTAAGAATLTNKTIDANGSGNSISNLEVADFAANVVDTDGTLTANSATRIPSQSAVKTYADTVALAVAKRSVVRAATTANITIESDLNNGDALDGLSLVTGDLVLVKNQTAPAENGIYVVGVTPVRAPLFDTWAEHPGSRIAVQEGTTNADTMWFCTSNDGGTINVTSITFIEVGVVGSVIKNATAKTTPVDADTFPMTDSAASNALKKVTWANIKATLVTYLNSTSVLTAFQAAGSYITASSVATLTNKTFNANDTGNVLSNIETDNFATNVVDDDDTLAADSTTRIPTQAAVKGHVATSVAALQDDFAGGTTGQVLKKNSGTNYDWAWAADSVGGGEGGGDMFASVYDPNTIEADVYDVDNHVDGTVNHVFTAVDDTKLAAIEALADVTDAVNVGSSIHGATAKTTPTGADTIAIIDSAASNVLKKLSFTNLVAYLNNSAVLTAFQVVGSYLTDSGSATLTNKTIDANGTGNSITNLETENFAANVVDDDDTLAADSDTRIPTQAAVKAYADTKASASSTTTFTNKTIDANGTGNSISNLEVADFAANVVDTDGTFAANSNTRIPSQAAVKTYVDGVTGATKGTVRAATTANITIATALNNGDTLDGVTLATNDLVLVKDQSDPEDNGVYVVGVTPARSTQYDTWDEFPGFHVSVQEGTVNADTIWLCTSDTGGTLDTTALTFIEVAVVGSVIKNAAAKTTPVDADTFPLTDSEASSALKKMTWANIKAALVTYLNSTSILTVFLSASSTATLTNKTFNANDTGNSLSNVEVADFAANVVDTDDTLAADSDTRIPSQQAVKAYADTKASASSTTTFTNKTIDANGTGNSISNLEVADFAANVVDTDGTLAANSATRIPAQSAVKTYVDTTGLSLRRSRIVRAATTANITISTALNNADSLDGVTLATNDLVLVKNQTAPAENGIYIVQASPARAVTFDTWAEHPGTEIVVMEGTVNADTVWLCTANNGGTLDTTAITFSEISNVGSVINNSTAKTTPIDADTMPLIDSGAANVLKKVTWANIKATLVTYLNSTSILTAFAASTVGQGVHTIWVPASAMVSRTTNGAAAYSAELATNDVMVSGLAFDATTSEYAQFDVRMPKSWNESTVTAEFRWTAPSGTGSVTWGIQGLARSNDDPLDAAFGTAITVSDAIIATDDEHQTAETSAITIGGTPAEADRVIFQVYRDISDSFTADAILLGVTIFYTTNAATDT